MNQIKGREVEKRAVEIALCGGLSLLLIGSRGQGKSMLIGEASCILREAGIHHVHRIFECRPETLAGDWQDHDLVVRMSDLSAADYIMPPPAEHRDAVAARVLNATMRRKAEHPNLLDMPIHRQATELFYNAYEKMHLSPAQAASAHRVAATIAIMDGRSEINRTNIAEALSYSSAHCQPGMSADVETAP